MSIRAFIPKWFGDNQNTCDTMFGWLSLLILTTASSFIQLTRVPVSLLVFYLSSILKLFIKIFLRYFFKLLQNDIQLVARPHSICSPLICLAPLLCWVFTGKIPVNHRLLDISFWKNDLTAQKPINSNIVIKFKIYLTKATLFIANICINNFVRSSTGFVTSLHLFII